MHQTYLLIGSAGNYFLLQSNRILTFSAVCNEGTFTEKNEITSRESVHRNNAKITIMLIQEISVHVPKD